MAAADVTRIAEDVSKTGLLPDCCTLSLFRWVNVAQKGPFAGKIYCFKAWLNYPEERKCEFNLLSLPVT
jgi:hypothetical protein